MKSSRASTEAQTAAPKEEPGTPGDLGGTPINQVLQPVREGSGSRGTFIESYATPRQGVGDTRVRMVVTSGAGGAQTGLRLNLFRFRVFQRKRLAPAERVAVQTPWQRPQWKSGGAEKEEAEVKPEVSNSKEEQRAKIKAKGGKRKKRLEEHEHG